MSDVEKTLNNFAATVINKAKRNLSSLGKRATGTLAKSMKYKTKVSKNSFELDIFMADYWEYVDAGVKGVGGKKADGTRWKKKRVTSRPGISRSKPFAYKKLKPPTRVFDKWSIVKGIAPRGGGGQFQKREGLKFALATSVYHTGIETTYFFTGPFEKEFKKLDDELLDAFGLELEQLIEFSTKKIT